METYENTRQREHHRGNHKSSVSHSPERNQQSKPVFSPLQQKLGRNLDIKDRALSNEAIFQTNPDLLLVEQAVSNGLQTTKAITQHMGTVSVRSLASFQSKITESTINVASSLGNDRFPLKFSFCSQTPSSNPSSIRSSNNQALGIGKKKNNTLAAVNN